MGREIQTFLGVDHCGTDDGVVYDGVYVDVGGGTVVFRV